MNTAEPSDITPHPGTRRSTNSMNAQGLGTSSGFNTQRTGCHMPPGTVLWESIPWYSRPPTQQPAEICPMFGFESGWPVNPYDPMYREKMKLIASHFTCRGCGEICETVLAGIVNKIMSGKIHRHTDNVECCRCRHGASKILENRSIACPRCLSKTPGISATLPSFM